MTFFEYIAEQVRELLAALGFRTLEEAIGQVEVLDTAAAIEHWKADGLDLSPMLAVPADAVQRRAAARRASRTTVSTRRWTTR